MSSENCRGWRTEEHALNVVKILEWAREAKVLRLVGQPMTEDGSYSCTFEEGRLVGWSGGWLNMHIKTSVLPGHVGQQLIVKIIVDTGLDREDAGLGVLTRTDAFEIGTDQVGTPANEALRVLTAAGLPKRMLDQVCPGIAHLWFAALASKSLPHALPVLPLVLIPIVAAFLH